MINLSKIRSSAGSKKITVIILMMEPRDKRLQMDPIISILEYIATPNVAPKKHSADVIIDGTAS